MHRTPHINTSRTAGRRRKFYLAIACLGLLQIVPIAASARASGTEALCRIGTYELDDGRVIDIAPAQPGELRWRDLSGRTGRMAAEGSGWVSYHGWTDRLDGIRVSFGSCEAGSITFGGSNGRKLPFEVTDVRFTSRGQELAGRLVMPSGSKPVPIVVLVHGSERHSARELDYLQRLFPVQGVGAFVYDKRGTGASQGTYTQDFQVLAEDATAALAQARILAGQRAGRVGYQGASQGGWVAPLAATRSDVDFVIVSFGLAVSVLDEDQEAIAFAMRLKGHGEDEVRKALEVGRAAAEVFESGFTRGFAALEQVRAKYGQEPWFEDVRGNFTHVILELDPEELGAVGPQFRFETPFRYEPMPTLEQLTMPQLWILGGQDLDAPAGETSRRLKLLAKAGKPITLAVYPDAEHGMTLFETNDSGERISTRYASGYFKMMADFARTGVLEPPYGDACLPIARANDAEMKQACRGDRGPLLAH